MLAEDESGSRDRHHLLAGDSLRQLAPHTSPGPLISVRELYLGALLSLSIGLLWILPLWSSFWLDETITYWVVKDGLSGLFRRSLLYNAQSPIYFLIAWVAVAAGGTREWVLRMPSLLAAAASTVLIFRLGVRFGDRETGALAAVCFASYWLVADAAATARGYAMGLLVLIAAVLFLERWLDRGHAVDRAMYVILCVLTVYIQPLFAVMFLVHVVYVVERGWRGMSRLGWREALVTGGVIGLLLIPLALALPPVCERRMWMSAVSGATFRGWGDVRFALAPLGVIAGGAWCRRRAGAFYRPGPAPFVLLACWSAMPVLLIVAVARWVTPTVLVSRYFLCAAPAIALTTAWAIRGVRSVQLRLLLVTVVATLSVVGMGVGVERMEDWRAALRAAAAATDGTSATVLVGAGFVESARLQWPLDHEEAGYLVSPVSVYRVPGPAIPLPYDLDRYGIDYLRQLSADLTNAGRPFVLVLNTSSFFHGRSVPFREWFEHAVGPRGFVSRPAGHFGTMEVVVFERTGERDPVEPGM